MIDTEGHPEAPHFGADELARFATELLEGSGLATAHARRTAAVLVQADLLGRSSHGMFQLERCLLDLKQGAMTKTGEAETLVDGGTYLLWDGRGLPGMSLLSQAMDLVVERLPALGVVVTVIRGSHVFGCLSAYLTRATERGLFVLIACANPNGKSVAPFGGIDGVLATSPIAAGIPSDGSPILVDMSTASTAFHHCRQVMLRNERLRSPWLLDHRGVPTDDPTVLFDDSGGTILPLGGTDLGHKGFALALMIQAMTSALGGYDRTGDATGHRRQNAFLLLIDPDAFGGRIAFQREMSLLATACQAVSTRQGGDAVRLPGHRALARRAEQLRMGIPLSASTLDALAPWADRLGVDPPLSFRRTDHPGKVAEARKHGKRLS